MSELRVNVEIVRAYAEATRRAFGPLLDENTSTAELARLLIDLAEATVQCAEQIDISQIKIFALACRLGASTAVELRKPFQVIDGGLK